MANTRDFQLPYNALINYVPKNLRNSMITSLLNNLFDRFLTHDESVPLYGYVGKKPSGPDDKTPRVPQPSAERNVNTIIPVLKFNVGGETVTFTVQDLVKKAAAIGISTEHWHWLYSQGNNFLPPIDIDKFANFHEYFWVAKVVGGVPNLPWNPELAPEYYTIARPSSASLDKMSVAAATNRVITRTGSGFEPLTFEVLFSSPTKFTVTPVGSRPYPSINFELSNFNQKVEYNFEDTVSGTVTKLIEFNIVREEIFNQEGAPIGRAGFTAGDKFVINAPFMTPTYSVTFTGSDGVKGKITSVKALNEYQKVDGVQLREGDRVLVKDASPANTGIYVVRPGNWERAADFNGETATEGARVFVRGGESNGGKLFVSSKAADGFSWTANGTVKNINDWQEGNFWVKGTDLPALGINRFDVIQASRPIIEFHAGLQLNHFVKDGVPSASGDFFEQQKTEFNQVPLFDLFRYDGTHAGRVSSIFYYEEDETADLDLGLQRRVKKSNETSADYIFNHGCVDESNRLLFFKRDGQLETVWRPGFSEPTIADITFAGAGTGTLIAAEAADFAQQQIWTITAETPSVFGVSGSKMVSVAEKATVGQPYSNGEISFTIQAGNVPFEPGDTFIIRVGNLETPRYVKIDEETGNAVDIQGGPAGDTRMEGAWQVPRTFFNNPNNDIRGALEEGVLYSHFRGILVNQVPGAEPNYSFGGSVKLWSEQQTLLAALLMQRDLTPISIIDLAQRQYETGLNAVRDIFQRNIIQYLSDVGPVETVEDVDALLDFILEIRSKDNDVRTVLFDSTSPVIGFPATLPQLGILPPVKPTITFDPVLGRTLLVHHDGHLSPLVVDDLNFRQSILGDLTTLEIRRKDGTYTPALRTSSVAPVNPKEGEIWALPTGKMQIWYAGTWKPINLADTLNSVVLRVENRLYRGMNPNARHYDFSLALQDSDFKAQLKRELFSFAASNSYDPLGPDFQEADPFTWNYSQASVANFPALGMSTVPARWHNILLAHHKTFGSQVIPTARPNIEPWKLLGYEDGDEWWSSLPNTKRIEYTPRVQLDSIDETYINGGAVKVVKTADDITALEGLQVIDGVQLQTGDRVLLQNEVAAQNNGIWVVSQGFWTRAATPLVEKLVVTVTAGEFWKGSTWVLEAAPAVGGPIQFVQARYWTTKLWEDIQLARPGLRLSVNIATDTLLPPYVSSQGNYHSVHALTTVIPPGRTSSYEFLDNSPVEAVWMRSLEFGYSLARALFRFDPLAFLGFTWGFNWVEPRLAEMTGALTPADGILLLDGLDMQVPGHKRFRLHGETVPRVSRDHSQFFGAPTTPLVITYTAYDENRRQNFTVTAENEVIGYAIEGFETVFNNLWFKIEDGGIPFRIGDRFEIDTEGNVIFVPTPVLKIHGFGQTFTHALREMSIDTTTSYAISAFREWEVRMGYRAGGLVSTADLNVFTQNETLSPAAYDLILKKSPIARNEWVQALRISVLNFGERAETIEGFVPVGDGSDWVFRIEGYNPRYLDISYFEMGGDRVTFHALSKAHTPLTWLQPTSVVTTKSTTLPLTITGVQNVVDFLFGYKHYLESRGWEFNKASADNIDVETGRTRNFQLEIEKFIDRVFAGIKVGQGHIVNPFMDKAWFNQKTGLVAEFIDSSLFDVTGHPGVFDVLGVKFKKSDLIVERTNEQTAFKATGPMFSAHIQVDEFEHLFVFNNFARQSTMSGVLYDPFSGSRVTTYRFNGRKQATSTMRPEFGGHFLVGNQVHRNLQASTDMVERLYDTNTVFENETASRHAMALLGFNNKDYFNSLDISDKTQFNFWRGLIQAKGTNMSIDAYLNNNRFDDAKIDEYWAYKVAEYGDAKQNAFPEIKLYVRDVQSQFAQFIFDPPVAVEAIEGFETFTEISRYDESRWFTLDDLGLDMSFRAEKIGTYTENAPAVGKIIKLPFVADWLEGDETAFEKLNETTILALRPGPLEITGYGPARSRFNPVKLFNYVDNELIEEIPMWHPAAGIHTPIALECINIISDINPAKFNYSTEVLNNNSYDPLRAWGEKEVGRIWLDTTNLEYVPYFDKTIFKTPAERLSRWGALADYASIDVYEWVASTVPPAEYNALAKAQVGNADLDENLKAAGEVAGQKTYVRRRKWFARPIAWAYSPVPVNVDWGATPPMHGGSTDANLTLINGLAVLDKGTFAGYGITAGMRLGAWNNDEVDPKPLSEYIIENQFSKLIIDETTGTEFTHRTVGGTGLVPATIRVVSTGHSSATGQLLFSAGRTVVVPAQTNDNGEAISWSAEAEMIVTETGGDTTDHVIVTSALDTTSDITVVYAAGETITVNLPVFNLDIVVTIDQAGAYSFEALRNSIVEALGYNITLNDAVVVTPVVPGDYTDLSNDPQDNDYRYGWRAWSVPTQAELDADTRQPISSWKTYVGDLVPTTADLAIGSDDSLTLNDGTAVSHFVTTWGDWELVSDVVKRDTVVTDGITLEFEQNIDPTRLSVYVNGITQLKSAYSVSGKQVVIPDAHRGDEVVAIIRKYEPTAEELEFDPEIEDDLSFQAQYKRDYEYVSRPVRDTDGSLKSTIYYFWVKNKTTAAVGKKLSTQAIAQALRDGPANFITFQNGKSTGSASMSSLSSTSSEKSYNAITISGLTNVVSKDDTFKLRFTRNFTLRDDPEELKLKNVHTEWTLMRPGQKTRIPEKLWQKLTDAVAGKDAAGNQIPAESRVLYDEKYGTRTRFGFGPEQTLAPAELLRASVTHAILNTQLTKAVGGVTVPDYISFLDLDASDTWFSTAEAARETMTNIWNRAKPTQVNEIFFAALNDLLAHNYELTDIFKTSRLSAYSIKVVRPTASVPTYE